MNAGQQPVISGPDYASYIRCMEEIKRRQQSIDAILNGSCGTLYRYTNVEFVALQFRKIFELIILSTLASHHHLFEGLTRKLTKEWQITKIISIVEKKNNAFYPKPIDRVPSDMPGIADEWKDVPSGFLELDELVSAHGMIGAIMHATNPYRKDSLFEEVEEQFSVWREKLIRLLDNHLIKFPGDEKILYVGMQNQSGGVHTSLFEKQQSQSG